MNQADQRFFIRAIQAIARRDLVGFMVSPGMSERIAAQAHRCRRNGAGIIYLTLHNTQCYTANVQP